MEKALVLGASGGMGYSIVKELSDRGIAVTAFARTRSKLEKLFQEDSNVTICTGDIFNQGDLKVAAKDVDIIFQSANIPYIDWEDKLLLFMNNIVSVAKESSVKLAVVDNIYAYGRSAGKTVTETSLKNPHTKKGRIRLQVENMIKDSGVKALITHFPDFYGPNAENTILHYTLQKVVNNQRAIYVGNKSIAKEFIFTPDGAKAMVNLAFHDQAYGQNWNIPGYGVITGNEIISVLRDLTGYDKGVTSISKHIIRMMGLLDPNMREVVEMFYLNEEPVVLNGRKYEMEIGPLPKTSYREGLNHTIDYMRKK
jgi:nucleoside-diphosphate-sugar epimerase